MLLLVLWLGNLFSSCFYDSSRLVALELIEHLSTHLDFNLRLNYVLPLVREAFATGKTKQEIESYIPQKPMTLAWSQVIVKALQVILKLFNEADFVDGELSAVDNRVTTLYIFPKIKDILYGCPLLRFFVA